MALDFPSSPSATDVHNAANGLQYVFDGVKWISQGRYDTGAINAEKLDNISSNFNGVLTTFNLKVNNITVKPASAESLHIVLAGHLQEPSTAYTINSVNGTITFASAPSNGTAFFGVILSRLPLADTTGTSTITNANVAANAAIDGTKINPNFGSQTITGVTTTQGSTDNTTKLASTAFVQTAISNLVDSSPNTLNTLNELAAALGDDADFSTTITTALAAKAPLASPTFTGTVSGISYNDLDDLPSGSNLTTENVQDIVGAMVTGNTETGISVTYNDAGDGTGKLDFATTGSVSSSQTFDDNVKAIFGTSNDGLEIYHDGNNSIIDDTGTGDLLLFGTSIKLQRTNSTPESLMIEAFGGNAVKLYYDGALKFETDTAGAKWSGDLFADAFTNSGGGKIKMGPSGALQIYHDNTNSIIDDSGTGSLLVYGSNVIIQESGTSNVIADFHPNTVKLYKSNKEKLITTDNGIEIKGDSSSSTDGSIQLNCSANSHGVKIKSPNHSAGQSYTIILPDNQIAVNKILKVKSISGSGSTAIGQLEFADDTDTALPTASSSTLGGIKVGTNLSIDGNGVLSASQLSLTSSNINTVFGDTTQLILGSGASDAALKLYYGTGSGTSYGVITADNGVHIQFDGANRLETHASGTKWIGDLNCDDNQTLKLGSSADLKIYHDQNNSIIDGTGTGSLLLYASDIIFHEKSDASHRMADFAQDGSTGVRLYNDNSVKLATTASGIDVTGGVNAVDGANNQVLLNPSDGSIEISRSSAGAFIDFKNTTSEDKDARIQENNGGFDLSGNVNIAAGLDVTGTVTVTDSIPVIKLVDSEENDDYAFINRNGLFVVRDDTNGVDRITLDSSGTVDVVGNLDVGAGIDVTGNITVTGTVDGVDIAALNTTVSGIASPTASTINALYPDNGNLILGTGTGDDTLKLYYDGTNAKITSDNAIHLQQDGANKLEISSSGVKWIGDLFCDDSQAIKLGSSADLRLYHDGANSYISDQGAGSLKMLSSLFEFKDESDGKYVFYANPDFNTYLYYDGSVKLSTQSSGVKWVGDLYCDDSNKLRLGSAGDLNLYHDGTHSRINNSTGYLTIKSDQVALTNGSGDHDYITVATADTGPRLHYDNAVMLDVKSWGVEINGDLGLDDNRKLALGNLPDLLVYHDGTHSFVDEVGNGNLILRTNPSGTYSTLVLQSGRENSVICNKLGSVELYHISGVGSSSKKFETNSNGCLMLDNSKLLMGDDGDLQIYHDGSNSIIDDSGTGSLLIYGSDIILQKTGTAERMADFAQDGSARLYYDNSIKLQTNTLGVGVGTDDTIIYNHSSSDSNYSGVVLDGAGSIQIARHNDQCLLLNRMGTDGTIESFYNDGTYVGGIAVSGGTTVYATSSDYRLKENVITLSDAITRLKTLKPYRFNFIGKSLTMDGFFAHEVTAVPEAIVGEKDAEEMQGLDYAKLTPLLTAALQEAIAKIETLETKVAALEAA